MTTTLGVNEHHHNQVVNYMRFARYQRGQRLRAVDSCFRELKDSRLVEETFTVDEVTDMLDELLMVVRGEVESELINTAHTNVLLMRQVFQQAEKWHLKLQADISELENRELLEQIRDFEDQEFAGAKRDTEFNALTMTKLEPLNDAGGAALLHMKIEQLQEENEAIFAKLQSVEGQAAGLESDKHQLADDLLRSRSKCDDVHSTMDNESPLQLERLKKEMSGLKMEMDLGKKSSSEHANVMETDLAGTKHELLRIREMLEMAEKELEKKVQMTTPFKNMKQMLMKKNDLIKDLRKSLAKYEKVSDD